MKKQAMRLFRAAVALVLVTCIAFSTVITASAAVVEGETIVVDDDWRKSWPASVESIVVGLEVLQTGLYQISAIDHMQTGYLGFLLYDTTDGTGEDARLLESFWLYDIVASYTTKSLWLDETCEYELECFYLDYYGNPTDADITLAFNKSTEELKTIPTCELAASQLQVNLENEASSVWLKYTAAASGDYSFNFGDLHAWVDVYDVKAEKLVYSEDSEYMNDAVGYWAVKSCLVIPLEANKEYYILLSCYSPGGSDTYISMTKNAKTVQSITIDESLHESYSPFDDIDEQCFTYKIAFTDNTNAPSLSYEDVKYYGYETPYVYYAGDLVSFYDYEYEYDREYPVAGNQPVICDYKGAETTAYVTITSFTDWLLEKNADAIDANENCEINYEDEFDSIYWWRIKVSKSGMYAVYRYNDDDFGANFDYYAIDIVDDKNNIVEYDEDLYAWPLIAGKEYALRFNYKYDEAHRTNDIIFWLQKEANIPGLQEGWVSDGGKWYYYEGGTMVKNAWRLIDGKWYFLDATGCMLANQWRKDSVGWVYLGSNGAMLTNSWCTDSQGWCYVGADGYAVTNCWKKDSYGWIWLNANGSMTKNAWVKDGGKWYFLDVNGYMVSNAWRKDSVGWVYLGSDGAMLTNAWCKDSKGWCYVGADGYAVTNCWKKDSYGWIWLDNEGSMTKSKWLNDGGKWYYLDANGYMVTGTRWIDGRYYTFNSSGVWDGK